MHPTLVHTWILSVTSTWYIGYISWFSRIRLPCRVEWITLIKEAHSDVVFAQNSPLANTGRTLSALLPLVFISLCGRQHLVCVCWRVGHIVHKDDMNKKVSLKLFILRDRRDSRVPWLTSSLGFYSLLSKSMYKNIMSIMRTKCRNFANNCCRAKHE
jgi:hypothetical protein